MADFKHPSVLMFGWEFPPFHSGGLGVACEGLTKALAASGVDLTFVLPFKIPISVPWCKIVFANEADCVNEKQIKDLFAGYQSHYVSEETTKYGLPKFISSNLMQRVKAYAEMAPDIARKNPHSVIHAHDWLTYPAGIAAKEASGKPLVVHVHATQFDQCAGDNINREVYEIERAGMHAADMVVAVSNKTRNKVIEKYGINPNKVRVVYNGVEFNKDKGDLPHVLGRLKSDGAKVVLYAGRITVQKGPDYFVEMAKKVLQFEPNTYFVMIGCGDMEGEIIRKVAGLGMSDKFIFHGFYKPEELAAICKIIDIYIMPSVSEPFGIVPLEVMHSNKPVLISKETGVGEIINCALKSHFWDVDDMADKVVSVLRHSKLKNQLSENGCEEVKAIHWHKAAKSLIELYNNLVPDFRLILNPAYCLAA